jgi:formylglycine-generating enzyme required for sulfatase activity
MTLPARFAGALLFLSACQSPCAGQPNTPPERDPMVKVSSGSFIMGCAEKDDGCADDERPRHEVQLAAFSIDTTEVTVTAYRRCVAAGNCGEPGKKWGCNWASKTGYEDHPINCVKHEQATSYCAWQGKRLPTEAEWEKAARGSDGRIYPWGDAAVSCTYAVMREEVDEENGCGRNSTWPVGSKPQGRSPFGALDMIGNVQEWTSDRYGEDYYASSPPNDPTGPPKGEYRAVRGGSASWPTHVFETPRRSSETFLRASDRSSNTPYAQSASHGFRCAQSDR